jgi:hypothetical protein
MLPAIQPYLATKSADIIQLFDQALSAGWREAFRAFEPYYSSGAEPGEPDFVRGVFDASIPMLDTGLPFLFKGSGISVTTCGVFCHQSPIVELFGTSAKHGNRCELGDILFVFTFRHGSTVARNALLLQAKLEKHRQLMSYGIVDVGDGGPQFVLYNQWPPFRYVRGLTGTRSVQGGLHRGAQYAFFAYDRRYLRPYWLHAHAAMASNHTVAAPLGGELFDVLTGQSGRPFSDRATAANGNDWDRVIWDLLDITAQRTFNLRSSKSKNAPRGSSNVVRGSIEPPYLMRFASGLSADDLKEQWGSLRSTTPPDQPPWGEDVMPDDEPSGISTVFIDLTVYDPRA